MIDITKNQIYIQTLFDIVGDLQDQISSIQDKILVIELLFRLIGSGVELFGDLDGKTFGLAGKIAGYTVDPEIYKATQRRILELVDKLEKKENKKAYESAVEDEIKKRRVGKINS